MTVTTRAAGPDDAEAISVLMIANSASRGGTLAGDWSLPLVRNWIATGDLVLRPRQRRHTLDTKQQHAECGGADDRGHRRECPDLLPDLDHHPDLGERQSDQEQ